MADAPDSKSGPRKRVWVQVPPSVLATRDESHAVLIARPSLSFTNAATRPVPTLTTDTARQRLEQPLGDPDADQDGARPHPFPFRQAELGDRYKVPELGTSEATSEIGMVSPEPGEPRRIRRASFP
jgi:hypothetical protein